MDQIPYCCITSILAYERNCDIWRKLYKKPWKILKKQNVRDKQIDGQKMKICISTKKQFSVPFQSNLPPSRIKTHWSTKMNSNYQHSKIWQVVVIKFPDFSLTFSTISNFPDSTQNSLTFPWPWAFFIFNWLFPDHGNPVHMYYIREKEGKNENLKKEGKMRISILISIYKVHFAFLKMYK